MGSMSDIRVPGMASSEDKKAGWLRECVQLGESWLKAQRAYPSIAESLDMVLSPGRDNIPKDQSHVRIPRSKRQIRELVALLSNLRPTASNKTSDKKLYANAEVANKVDLAWWHNTFADLKFKQSFQAAALTGTVYVSHVWDTDLLGYKRGDIRTDVYDAREVLLISPPKDFDIQKCYAVIIKKRVPIHIVAARYPLRAHELIPDYEGLAAGGVQKGLSYVQGFMDSPLRVLGGAGMDAPAAPDDIFPTIDLYECYVYDLSVNMTGRKIQMGEPGTSWSYDVPSLGQDIPTGLNGWEGLPTYRKATPDDCRMYPLRRKIEATGTKILYDDTSEWWHGQVPLARFSFDDWYTEALGFPLSRDVASMEHAGNEILRGAVDQVNVILDPGMVFDENLMSERLALQLNPRAPGQRLKANLQMGEAIKALLPNQAMQLPTNVLEVMRYIADQQDWVIGARDVMALAKAKQIPSEGTIDKLAEMSGPLSISMTRSMELGQMQLGEMRRWLNFQFRTKADLMDILGDDGLTEEVYDYDPGNLIPSHMPDEDPEKGPSEYTQVQRAREYCGKMRYRVVPNSMARLQQMSHKLILLQLYQRSLLPSDPWSVAEDFELADWGPPPEGTKNRMERAIAWMRIKQELAQEGEEAAGGQHQRGRPSSNRKAPQVKQKSGGRSTVTTS